MWPIVRAAVGTEEENYYTLISSIGTYKQHEPLQPQFCGSQDGMHNRGNCNGTRSLQSHYTSKMSSFCMSWLATLKIINVAITFCLGNRFQSTTPGTGLLPCLHLLSAMPLHCLFTVLYCTSPAPP
jgi:hypothetical protein